MTNNGVAMGYHKRHTPYAPAQEPGILETVAQGREFVQRGGLVFAANLQDAPKAARLAVHKLIILHAHWIF